MAAVQMVQHLGAKRHEARRAEDDPPEDVRDLLAKFDERKGPRAPI